MKSLLLFLLFLCHGDGYQLELASVVFRHGDRTPIMTFPNSDYPISYWPQGPGQLTKIGMQQSYHLGKILHERYIDTGFINSNYTQNQVAVRSTDVDRTLMSGQCALANLFPPGPDQQFTSDLLWQPIPIHTVSVDEDHLLRGYEVEQCPAYDELRKNDKNTEEYKKVERENQELFTTLENELGVDTVSLDNIWWINDAIFIEYSHNLTDNYPWFNEDLLEQLMSLSSYTLSLFYNSEEKKRFTGGIWASKVLNDMFTKATEKDDDPSKIFLYSAHDTTVAAMLSVFNMYDQIQPQYSSAYIIELYSNNSDYFVEFHYRNETSTDTVVELFHPDCGAPCELDTLIRVMELYTVTEDQWKTFCGINASSSSKLSGIDTALIAITAILILLTIVMAIIAILAITRNRKLSYSLSREKLLPD